MSSDPWSRPTTEDLKRVMSSLDQHGGGPGGAVNTRQAERLNFAAPAEIRTPRGSTVKAITREISSTGIGLLHRGSIPLDEVTVRIASETREYFYRIQIEWCIPVDEGMFLSGGRFLPSLEHHS